MKGKDLIWQMYQDLYTALGWLDIYQQVQDMRENCKPGEEYKVEALEDRLREELSGEVLEELIANVSADISRYEQYRDSIDTLTEDLEVE